MFKPRHRCLVCGDPLDHDRLLTCSHDCYLIYKSWKRQGKLPGHKVRLTRSQRAEIAMRANRGTRGPWSRATALAQEFIEPDRRPPPPTAAELEHEAKWKAIREEWAKEDAADRKPKFLRRF